MDTRVNAAPPATPHFARRRWLQLAGLGAVELSLGMALPGPAITTAAPPGTAPPVAAPNTAAGNTAAPSTAAPSTAAPQAANSQTATPQGDSAKRRPLEILVISDTHLGYKGQESARRQWLATADELSKAPGALVLHLGDVVDGGREPQYALYKEIRERIGKPVHEIPGNHDPAELFARHIRPTIDSVVELDWMRFLLLNNSQPESHDGFLSPRQLAWIDEQCSAAALDRKHAIIGLHVPAHRNLHPDRGWFMKPADGQTRLYELLAKHRDTVLALFHGHFHNGLRGWDDHPPCHEICFPSALYNQDRKLREQQAPGYNLAEFRPGYTRVTIASDSMRFVYQPLGGAEGTSRTVPTGQTAS